MIYVSISLSVVVFIVAFVILRIVSIASEAIDTSVAAGRIMTNPNLDEDEKGKLVREASIALSLGLASILFRSFAAVAISILPLTLFDWMEIASFEETTSSIFTWQAICLSTVIAVIAYLVVRSSK